MSAIADSLKKLVVALGGASDPSNCPGNNISEVVDEITKVAKPGGGISGDEVWNAWMKDLVFVRLEPVSEENHVDITVECSDGEMSCSFSLGRDAETGDVKYYFGAWATNPDRPVPNYEQYIPALESNIRQQIITCLKAQGGDDQSFNKEPFLWNFVSLR